jgi:hypothetical protein
MSSGECLPQISAYASIVFGCSRRKTASPARKAGQLGGWLSPSRTLTVSPFIVIACRCGGTR